MSQIRDSYYTCLLHGDLHRLRDGARRNFLGGRGLEPGHNSAKGSENLGVLVVPVTLPFDTLLVLVEMKVKLKVVVERVVLVSKSAGNVADGRSGDGDDGVVGVNDDIGFRKNDAIAHESPGP